MTPLHHLRMLSSKIPFLSYGTLGFALGLLGLPLYTYLPKFYAEHFGISLVVIGGLFFFARFVDTMLDPFIGWYSDRLVRGGASRHRLIFMAFGVIVFSFLALLFPVTGDGVLVWLGLFLVLNYGLFSVITINYVTLATEYTPDPVRQTQFVSAREGFSLLGVAVGSILPTVLMAQGETGGGHIYLWALFCVSAGVAIAWLPPHKALGGGKTREISSGNFFPVLRTVLHNKAFGRLALAFLFSSIAASLPASLVLFFIQDVLQAAPYAGAFLGLYFLVALLGIPLWYAIATKIGKRKAWSVGMCLTIAAFVWAGFLGAGDWIAYGCICALTGFCLGADLIMPVALLGDMLTDTSTKATYFGIWTLISKASLAVAGSLGLFVLGIMGYVPGSPEATAHNFAVSFAYAIIPCVLKVISLIVLVRDTMKDEQ